MSYLAVPVLIPDGSTQEKEYFGTLSYFYVETKWEETYVSNI